MSIISYAQNFEDVILNRVFKGKTDGFFVDVGVWHPEEDSVTKHFYDLGWSGINVEALPEQHELIARERPRDVNLNVAAGTSKKSVKIHRVAKKNNSREVTGLSTTSDEYAATHRANGFVVESVEVPSMKLTEILDRHAGARVIDFLKIDVEGAEADVVSSNDWLRWRPVVVVVEATAPNSQIPTHEAWDPALIEASYSFVYFDGLSRWYVAKEHSSLIKYFQTPPNFFDDFVLHRTHELELKLKQASDRLRDMEQLSGSRRLLLRRLISLTVGRR